jgi:branched-chain amino acid transport system ATP-binding protein
VHAGEIAALIGGNGAGKTTTLRAVSGLLPLRRGSVTLDGRRISGLGSAAVVAAGIAHVPEGRQLFPSMTVLENLELGVDAKASSPEELAAQIKTEIVKWAAVIDKAGIPKQ